jgi:hypothetical protein
MKSFSSDSSIKNEYYADQTIAIDCVEIHLKDYVGNNQCLYLCNGGLNLQFDSPTAPNAGTNTYTAQGEFIGFSSLTEDFDVKVGKFSIYLSAIGNDYVNKIINYPIEGSRVVIYKAFLKFSSGGTGPLSIVSSPILMFDGNIFNFAINETDKSCQINIDCSSLFADFERTNGRKTNNWSNWLFQGDKNDNCFEKSGFVGQTEFKWGRI